MKNFVVAIDGPAGSGKSSISKMVAEKMGFIHIDTGAMYRAVTLEALNRNVDVNNEAEFEFLNETKIAYLNGIIYLNGKDVSEEIRSTVVTNNVSAVSKHKFVRDKMVDYQRASASVGKVLMDGRDIGTVVLPNANVKIFLTASPEVRAQRRYDEMVAKGVDVVYEVILEEIKIRDYKDSHREIAPLKQASDAILVDTSKMDKQEVCNTIIKIIDVRLKKMEDFKMEDLSMPKKLRVKDVVEGAVVQVDDTTIYLDIQNFTEGKMHLDHYTKDKSITSFKGIVKVGDVIRCEVAKVGEDAIYLSRMNQLSIEAFQKVVDACNEKATVTVTVKKFVQGKGYQVEYLGNILFMPLSQAPQNVKVGEKLEVRVLEADEKRKNAVVSRRVIEHEIYEAAKKAEMDAINVGDVLKGKVAKVEKFGAFVRFEYNQGLLRINEISHTFTNDINSVIAVDDEVEVKVISKENGKLLLSKKALLDTPFEAYTKNVKVGQTVTGKVANKLPFGLLIELADNVKGLLHASEYSHNPNDNFNNCVVIGDEVECAILAVDSKKEKISLSRKALMDNPWKRVNARLGDIVSVKVTEVLENGLNVEALGVDGFIPGNEVLTLDQNGTIKDYYNVGDTAQAEIIDIKPLEWKLRLSIKRIKVREERKAFEKYLEADDTKVTIGDLFKEI